MDIQTKILASLEIFGGVSLCAIVALFAWNSVGEFSFVLLVYIVLFLAFSLYGLAAGIGLWRYSAWGWRHSKIVQLLSIAVVSTPLFGYDVFLGARVLVGFFGSNVVLNFNLGGAGKLTLGADDATYGIAINLIAMWGLFALFMQQSPDAFAENKIEQDNS